MVPHFPYSIYTTRSPTFFTLTPVIVILPQLHFCCPFSCFTVSSAPTHQDPKMDNTEEAKDLHSQQPLKTHKYSFAAQICLRFFATAATLAATWIMLTSKQTSFVYGITVDARYSYSSAFKFFAYANLIACAFSVISLFLAFILGRKALNPKNYFYLFLHDLILTTLLMAGCAAATSIGYVGRYGNSYTGWVAICDHFAKFCNRVTVSVVLSYFCVVFYLCLTIISADKSRQIQD